MAYVLKRVSDGAGDSGLMSRAVFMSGEVRENCKPEIGAYMVVGSHYARSYSRQDYWQTTPVTEILKEWTEAVNEHEIQYVRFKTFNSEYVWSCDL
jgi:predicted MPP superfamily phosphohydrolase